MTADPADVPPRPHLAMAPDGETAGVGVPRIEITGNPDAIRKLKTALGQRAIPDLYVTGGRPVKKIGRAHV